MQSDAMISRISPIATFTLIPLQCENIAHCFRFSLRTWNVSKESGTVVAVEKDAFQAGKTVEKLRSTCTYTPHTHTHTWGHLAKSFCETHERWVHGRWEFSSSRLHLHLQRQQGMTVKMRMHQITGMHNEI